MAHVASVEKHKVLKEPGKVSRQQKQQEDSAFGMWQAEKDLQSWHL